MRRRRTRTARGQQVALDRLLRMRRAARGVDWAREMLEAVGAVLFGVVVMAVAVILKCFLEPR